MSTEQDMQDDWDDAGRLWQTQATRQVDIDRLRRSAAGRTARLVVMAALEVVGFAVALFMVLRFLASKPGLQLSDGFVIVLLAIAGAFTVWAVRNRRGLWRHLGLGPEALVRLEIDRAHAAIRFWQANRKVLFAIVAAVALLTAGWLTGWLDPPRNGRWWLPATVSIPMVVLSLLLERWRIRQLRERLDQLLSVKSAFDQ